MVLLVPGAAVVRTDNDMDVCNIIKLQIQSQYIPVALLLIADETVVRIGRIGNDMNAIHND